MLLVSFSRLIFLILNFELFVSLVATLMPLATLIPSSEGFLPFRTPPMSFRRTEEERDRDRLALLPPSSPTSSLLPLDAFGLEYNLVGEVIADMLSLSSSESSWAVKLRLARRKLISSFIVIVWWCACG
jgi:hypothetical protein